MRNPILVLGSAGQLGQELMGLTREREVDAIGMGADRLDIRDGAAVANALDEHRPRLIVNCAAYTAVDKAEEEPELAAALNVTGPKAIAEAAASRDIPLVHISTDYVFDGTKTSAYTENDPIAPLSVYGRTKAKGEEAVRETAARHVILRTSWLFGRYGSNFLKKVIGLVGTADRLRIIADQRGCPTSTLDLAEAILAVDNHGLSGPGAAGTFHFAGMGEATWFDFADAIVAAQAPLSGKRPKIEAIDTEDYPTIAKRPGNSVLDSSRFSANFGFRARCWRRATEDVVSAMLSSK